MAEHHSVLSQYSAGLRRVGTSITKDFGSTLGVYAGTIETCECFSEVRLAPARSRCT